MISASSSLSKPSCDLLRMSLSMSRQSSSELSRTTLLFGAVFIICELLFCFVVFTLIVMLSAEKELLFMSIIAVRWCCARSDLIHDRWRGRGAGVSCNHDRL